MAGAVARVQDLWATVDLECRLIFLDQYCFMAAEAAAINIEIELNLLPGVSAAVAVEE
jgi:hypothetical protein